MGAGRRAAGRRRADKAAEILLIVRTPPPYGGGEAVGALLQQLFTGTFAVLAFHRPEHQKATQGAVSLENLRFGIHYVTRSTRRLLRERPRAVYLDVPKDVTAFLRSSVVILAARLLGVRVVGDLAGGDFQFLERRGLVQRYGRRVLNSTYAIRVLGESVAMTLRSRGIRNPVVISNGIDEPPNVAAAAARTSADAVIHFLYVGKIARAKGIFILLEFADAFRAEGRPFRLDVVGEWADAATRTEVEQMVEHSRLGDLVVFHGRLVGDAKWACYAQAHLLLHPTYWDGQPVTILESLAYGTPVVATTIGAIPDTIGSGCEGYLMTENTAAELVAGVNEIMRDEQTYAAYRARARAAFESRFAATVFRARIRMLMEAAAAATAEPRRHNSGAAA